MSRTCRRHTPPHASLTPGTRREPAPGVATKAAGTCSPPHSPVRTSRTHLDHVLAHRRPRPGTRRKVPTESTAKLRRNPPASWRGAIPWPTSQPRRRGFVTGPAGFHCKRPVHGFVAYPLTAPSPPPSQLHRRPPHGSVAGAVRNSTAAHHPAHAISCSPRSPRRGLLAREGSSVTSSPRACAPRQAPPRRIVPASSHRCRRSPPARCRRSAWLPRSPSTSHR